MAAASASPSSAAAPDRVSPRTGACAVSFQPRRMVSRSAVAQDRQAGRARGCGVRHRGLQQPHQPLAKPPHRRSVEQVAGVFQHAVDAGRRRRRPRAARPARPTGRTSRSRSPPAAAAPQAPAAPAPPPPRSASNASITWNSGCRDSDRAGLSTSTSRSNGRSGMAIGRKVAAAHPPDQLVEARVARRVGAQHQRVDEEPDQLVQRRRRCGPRSGCRSRCRCRPRAASAARQAPPAAP